MSDKLGKSDSIAAVGLGMTPEEIQELLNKGGYVAAHLGIGLRWLSDQTPGNRTSASLWRWAQHDLVRATSLLGLPQRYWLVSYLNCEALTALGAREHLLSVVDETIDIEQVEEMVPCG